MDVFVRRVFFCRILGESSSRNASCSKGPPRRAAPENRVQLFGQSLVLGVLGHGVGLLLVEQVLRHIGEQLGQGRIAHLALDEVLIASALGSLESRVSGFLPCSASSGL